jgi:amidase
VADGECVAAVEATIALLESLGHRVESSSPAALDRWPEVSLMIFGAVVARDLDRWGERFGVTITESDVEPSNWFLAQIGRGMSASTLLAATETIQRWSRDAAQWWADGYDVLVTPTLPMLPPLIGSGEGVIDLGPFTMPWNLTGQPAVSVPLHMSNDGLPVGVQLIGPYGREDVLIRLASQLEQAAPWASRRPPVHA